jgi:pimeloyl-ACP methyl ester carboxylesterase
VFEFVDRKTSRMLVLISGWAFDCRIFSSLDLPYDYLLFRGDALEHFEQELRKQIATRDVEKVSLFGWSQGAFAAADFASKNPELVDELILAGARRQYENEAVERVQRYVKKNAHAFLLKFYKECFSKNEQEVYRRFRHSLFADYLCSISVEKLMSQLDWLRNKRIQSASLKDGVRVTFVHGGDDAIAPVAEIAELAGQIPTARLVVFEEAGHIPFLRNDFSQRLYEQ